MPRLSVVENIIRCNEKRNSSNTILWKADQSMKGMNYQDGKLTILTQGLYFIHCQLHFVVKECLKKKQDLTSQLNLNGKILYLSIQTVQKPENETNACKMYTNQHLSLQTELNVNDNISVHTSHAQWLNDDSGYSVDSFVFGAFMISENAE
uniref:THD domain-containing protein n=1 Tax=Pyxicephalus adspersus TaxID=30357 RepID=A0AAV3AI33_PYXAD|nr:TPA: hypothetical protein GDO54_018285 [Pyxicephalus adspersus]